MGKTIPLVTTFLLMASVFLADVFAKADITFNGDLQYRIRYHYVMLKDTAGDASSATPDLTNRYAWNLKCKINVNENLLFGIRLSNPSGYATDNIADNISWVTKGYYNVLSIPELYFKWNVGIFSLTGGIIPVKPNTVLDLVAYEMRELDEDEVTPGYYEVGENTWTIRTNNSQKGLDFGFKMFSNENVSFGMNLIGAMADDAKGTDTADVLKHDQVRLILSFPTSISENLVSLLPAMHVRFNTFRTLDKKLDKANHSIAGGCDVNLNFIENLNIKLGAAGGVYSNTCQEDDSTDTDSNNIVDTPVEQTAPFGVLFTSGITYSPTYGKLIVNFRYGRSRDRETSPALNNDVLFWEVKYAMPIKSLTFMPRMRIWYLKEEDSEATETRLRPELILKASF